MVAYVLNKHGKPLMPCSPGKARRLLKEGKAEVVGRTFYNQASLRFIRLQAGGQTHRRRRLKSYRRGGKNRVRASAIPFTEVVVHKVADLVPIFLTDQHWTR